MKKFNIPHEFINSSYRRKLWKNALSTIKKLEKVLPISSVYIIGSFVTSKRRPADVDLVIMLKIKPKNKKDKWSFDLFIGPDNDYGKILLKDYSLWMKQKYGNKKSGIVKLI